MVLHYLERDPVTFTWALSQYKNGLSRYGIPMLKIRRSQDRLIFNMGIPIPVRRHIYIETPRRVQCHRKSSRHALPKRISMTHT